MARWIEDPRVVGSSPTLWAMAKGVPMLMKQYTVNVSIHLANSLSGRTAPIPSHKGKKLWSAQRFSKGDFLWIVVHQELKGQWLKRHMNI